MRANRGGAAGVPMGANAYAGPGPAAPGAFAAYEEANISQPWQRPTRSGAAATASVNQDTNFPAQYIDKDPRDTLYDVKRGVIKEAKSWLGVGKESGAQAVVPITDADAAYFKHKMDQMEYANFKVWAEQWYDFTDPAQVRLFEEAFPDYYQQRAQLIKNLGDNSTKYAILRLLGPRTRDDFMFMWLVQTGKISLPTGALWEPSSWAGQTPPTQLALFNPWRMVSKPDAPNKVNLANRTDPAGYGTHSYAGLPTHKEQLYGLQDFLSVGQSQIPTLTFNPQIGGQDPQVEHFNTKLSFGGHS